MTRLAAFLICWAGAAFAQGATALLDARTSESGDSVTITLQISAITPYRVFNLDAPKRLILDVEDLSLEGFDPSVLSNAEMITDVRAGPFRPGWTRIILDLSAPLLLESARMGWVGDDQVAIEVTLAPVDPQTYATKAVAPPDPGWEEATGFDPQEARRLAQSEAYVVLLDAGHGGIDRGIVTEGIKEADIALIMAEELAVRLNATEGIRAVLSREGDIFVPDDARIALGREIAADLILSFHANRRTQGGVRVLTRDPDVTPVVADDGGTSDTVAAVLGDLAGVETLPASQRVADALVASFGRTGIPLDESGRTTGTGGVLRQATIPTVLIELGGLGDPQTRAYLGAPEGRNKVAAVIAETIILLAR